MDLHGSSIDHRPLLPEPLNDRLRGSIARIAGAVLLAGSLAGWLSLATWSARDPSLTHAAGGATRNWMGPLGAIVSDLMLQMIGLAAIFAMVIVTFAAGELIVRRGMRGFRSRILVAPLALAVLAGALASLPTPGTWPLHHGLGGALGGVVFKAVAGLLAIVNPARAGAAAGLVLFGGGMCLLTSALGLTYRDYAILLEADPAEGKGWLAPDNRLLRLMRRIVGSFAPPAQPEHSASRPPHVTGEGRAATEDASIDAPVESTPVDEATDLATESVARRFAPKGTERVPEQSQTTSPRAPKRSPSRYAPPQVQLLSDGGAARSTGDINEAVLRGNARLLEDVLADFGVKGEIKDIRPGPVVTLYELVPARGTKSARVIALADDIARSMSAASARVAVVPGRNAIGIELPNARRQDVHLRDLLESRTFGETGAQLPIALGRSIGGEPIIVDLARMPHLLIAGTTGSGKSVGLNAIILSLLYRLSPRDCRLVMIDPKMLELSAYNGIPHLLAPVVTDPNKAPAALEWVVREMEERYKRMSKLGVRNIEMFNERARSSAERGQPLVRRVQTGFDPISGAPIVEEQPLSAATMPYIVVVVDEFADLMAVAGKEIEITVQRLAQMARAAGIHLIMATQRPSVDVITGTIKANFPTRISFKVASKIDSRTILGEQGAEQLLGRGDMLIAPGTGPIMRVHGPFVSDDEVEQVANYLKRQGPPDYVDMGLDRDDDEDEDAADALFDRAVALVVRERKASPTFLQKRLALSHTRATELLVRMERDGVVGPATVSGKRDVLL